MIGITFGKNGGSGPLKAPCSMPARLFMELQRHGLGMMNGNRMILPDGVHITTEPPPPLTSLAGLLFRLNHHPAHLAGHYPHSSRTAEHRISVDPARAANAPALEYQISTIFRRWPRVQVGFRKE